MADLTVGTKLECRSCGTELIVIKAPAGRPECCGEPLEPAETS